jgi:hypothetical protein
MKIKLDARKKRASQKNTTDDGVQKSIQTSSPPRRKSESSTSPDRPSTISRRQSAPNVLGDSQRHRTPATKESKHPPSTFLRSQSDSGLSYDSSSDSEFSTIDNLRKLKHIEQTQEIPRNEDNSSVSTDISSDRDKYDEESEDITKQKGDPNVISR